MRLANESEDCRVVHAQLLGVWLGEVDEVTLSALLDHLSECRSCLKWWIAIQAAADLALCSPTTPDEEAQGELADSRWRPVCLPGSDGTW